MSYWNEHADKMAGGNENSMFLKFKENEPRTLLFKGHEIRAQRPDTPEAFKSSDGNEVAFLFMETVNGRDENRIYTARSFKNALSISLKNAGVDVGDTFTAVRSGTGMDTRYAITKGEAGEVKLDANNPF